MPAGPHHNFKPSNVDHAVIAARLQTDQLRVEGRMPWSSNATFLVTLAESFPAVIEESADHPSEVEPSQDDLLHLFLPSYPGFQLSLLPVPGNRGSWQAKPS